MIRAQCASRDKRNSSPLPPSTRQICRVEVVAPTLSDSNCPYLLHALAPQGQSPRRGRDARLSDNSNIAQPFPQPSSNRFPTLRQPSGTSTNLHPSFNRHATASQSQPRRNRFPITIQSPEAARRTIPRLANIHDSTILRVESKNDSDSTVPHPRSLNRQYRAAWPWLVHQLPRSPRHFLHHPRREGNRQAAGNGAMSAAGGEKRKPLQNVSFAVPAQLLLTIAEGLWYTFPNLGKNHVLPINGKWWQS